MRCSAGGGRTQSRLCAWCRLSAGKVGKHCGAVPPAIIALMPHHPRQYEEVSLSHPAKKGTKQSVKRTFTDEERAAMKERVRELKAPEAGAASAARETGGRGGRPRKAPCSRRSPRCGTRIAPWASGSMRSLEPARQPCRRNSG